MILNTAHCQKYLGGITSFQGHTHKTPHNYMHDIENGSLYRRMTPAVNCPKLSLTLGFFVLIIMCFVLISE